MQHRMRSLWTLGGISFRELLVRTVRESWEDAVFGQAGRMAFYHFLALFPSVLILLSVSSWVPHFGKEVQQSIQDLSSQVLPADASRLFQSMVNELHERALSGVQFLFTFAGACWALFNATWAIIYGLNKAYEVEERRPPWKLALLTTALATWAAIAAGLGMLFIFFGKRVEADLHSGAVALRICEWLAMVGLLLLSFALFYRFGPNLRDTEWRWSTPGALCAIVLWLLCTFGARIYFDHINDYRRAYGHMNGVVMLLLWLYLTNSSIVIGAEMNSEIEKAARCDPAFGATPQDGERSGS